MWSALKKFFKSNTSSQSVVFAEGVNGVPAGARVTFGNEIYDFIFPDDQERRSTLLWCLGDTSSTPDTDNDGIVVTVNKDGEELLDMFPLAYIATIAANQSALSTLLQRGVPLHTTETFESLRLAFIADAQPAVAAIARATATAPPSTLTLPVTKWLALRAPGEARVALAAGFLPLWPSPAGPAAPAAPKPAAQAAAAPSDSEGDEEEEEDMASDDDDHAAAAGADGADADSDADLLTSAALLVLAVLMAYAGPTTTTPTPAAAAACSLLAGCGACAAVPAATVAAADAAALHALASDRRLRGVVAAVAAARVRQACGVAALMRTHANAIFAPLPQRTAGQPGASCITTATVVVGSVPGYVRRALWVAVAHGAVAALVGREVLACDGPAARRWSIGVGRVVGVADADAARAVPSTDGDGGAAVESDDDGRVAAPQWTIPAAAALLVPLAAADATVTDATPQLPRATGASAGAPDGTAGGGDGNAKDKEEDDEEVDARVGGGGLGTAHVLADAVDGRATVHACILQYIANCFAGVVACRAAVRPPQRRETDGAALAAPPAALVIADGYGIVPIATAFCDAALPPTEAVRAFAQHAVSSGAADKDDPALIGELETAAEAASLSIQRLRGAAERADGGRVAFASFEAAVEGIRAVRSVSQRDQLRLYGLYKVAGGESLPPHRPSAVNVAAAAKYDAWAAVATLSQEEAMGQYVTLAEQLANRS